MLLEDYKRKLIVDGIVLPDPFTISEKEWIGEQLGMSRWPQVFFCDITDYLKSLTPAELYTRLCNEYKEGKAYRYVLQKNFVLHMYLVF
jgi:hypothetical protein